MTLFADETITMYREKDWNEPKQIAQYHLIISKKYIDLTVNFTKTKFITFTWLNAALLQYARNTFNTGKVRNKKS